MSRAAADKAPSCPPALDGSVIPSVYLHAGQLHASATPCSIVTILGSCVAVCLYDPVSGAGGANHFLLPTSPGGTEVSARFGDVSIAWLLSRMASIGSRPRDVEAKLFGGASVVLAGNPDPARSLGMQNVEMARRLLGARGVRVVAEDVGGTRGRKLTFRSDLGDVWVRKL